jgi:hypothetical protein
MNKKRYNKDLHVMPYKIYNNWGNYITKYMGTLLYRIFSLLKCVYQISRDSDWRPLHCQGPVIGYEFL